MPVATVSSSSIVILHFQWLLFFHAAFFPLDIVSKMLFTLAMKSLAGLVATNFQTSNDLINCSPRAITLQSKGCRLESNNNAV